MGLVADWRVACRRLAADPGASLVIVFGLAVALACAYLVAQVAVDRLLPDPDVPDPARVVSVEILSRVSERDEGWFDGAPFVLAAPLRGAAPAGTLVARSNAMVGSARAGERTVPLGVQFADPEIVDILGLRAQRGDLRAALARPDGVALTAAAAARLFGGGEALGRTLRLHGHDMTVLAILPHASAAAMRGTDALVRFDSTVNWTWKPMQERWFWVGGQVFARLAPGMSAEAFGALAQRVFDEGPARRDVSPEWTANGRRAALLRAMPLTRRALQGAGSEHRVRELAGLVASAGLVLALALANALNLGAARTLARAREVAIRKALGASPLRLAAQFMTESALAAALAAVAGLLLAWLAAPTFAQWMSMRPPAGLLSPVRIAALLGSALALGALGGLPPARVALRVRCAPTLAGRAHDEGDGGRRLRRGLTAMQFAIALALCAAAGAVWWQTRWGDGLDRGLRTGGLVAIDLPEEASPLAARAFREALAHAPGVDAASWSGDVPGRGHWTQAGELATGPGGRHVTVSVSDVDVDFFAAYGLAPLAGRLPVPTDTERPDSTHWQGGSGAPAPERVVVLDAAAVRALGFGDPAAAVGARVFEVPDPGRIGDALRIAAVVPAIRQASTREAGQASLFAVHAYPQRTLTLRGPDVPVLMRAVEAAWSRSFPDELGEPVTVEDALAEVYDEDRRIGRLALAASAFALVLAGLGVYALAAHAVRRATREIVVRKLYGAGASRVAALLAREFAPLLLLAALAGLPAGAWLVHAWLEGFVERAPFAYGSLALALGVLVATTALAAARHGLAAMRLRPAAVLRD